MKNNVSNNVPNILSDILTNNVSNNVSKRCISLFLSLAIVLSSLLTFSVFPMVASAAGTTTVQATYYVSPTGLDSNDGLTPSTPFQTIAKAKAVVRTLPKTGGDIVVQIADGFYPQDQTLTFDKDDSGSATCTIRYEAAPGAKPVISGGQMLDKNVWIEATGLTQAGGLTVYKTTLNRNEKLRAIYVNNKRANMTVSPKITSANRTTTGTPTVSFDGTNNPWAWQNGSGIRAAIVFGSGSGLTQGTKNPQNIEAESLGGARWARPFVCFASAEAAPSASNMPGGTMLRFQMPYAAISESLSNNTQYNPGNDQVIRNAFEFLNKRGDFYFDQAASTLYYIPLQGEDINTADVVIPKIETVVDVRGIPVGDRLNPIANSDEGRVRNITFNGLTFAHTDYKLYELTGTYTLSDGTGTVTTNSHGFASVQGCIVNKVYFPSTINWHETFYRGYDIPPAAVMVNAARNIKVLNGEIGLTGFNGIHLENDVQNCEVTGNYIVDTLSSGVVVGHPQHIYENDKKDINESSDAGIKSWSGIDKEKFQAGTESVPQNILITNNFLYRNCYGFPGANSLTSFYTTNMSVLHNYLYDSTYGAMNIGWGWCEYDGYGFNGTQTGGPYTGTNETSKGRSPEISTTSRNNHINYNRVEEICTVVNDSGAIYSLGRQGDPGNKPDGGTWDTVNNLTSSPVTDPNNNWNPDNWTNFTEMNYNFLNPNATDRPQDSNNWTNGFHPDEGSTFIKMNYNVVQSKLSYSPGRSRLFEFNNWKRKSDMTAIGGYVDGDNDQSGGPRITFDNYKSVDRIWPVAGNKIVLDSGLTDEYTHMIPKSLIADTEFELASNVTMGKSETLNRRGLLKAEDTVWLAPAGTTNFIEGKDMTKAAGNAKTINAPAAPGAYKLYIVYGDGSPTATSKYTAYVDTSTTSVNVQDGKSYQVSAVQPLKLTLSNDYTYTLNGNPISDGYEIGTEGSWTLVLTTPTSTTTTIKFTTTVSEANKLLQANVSVAPGGTVRFAYDLNDATKELWLSAPSDGNFIESVKETKAYGNALGMTAPMLPGTYVIFVRSKDGTVLSQSHARVVVSDTTPVDTSVDKTLLTALIGATNSLNNTGYTTNSWNAFQSALSAAQAAASDAAIGQKAADNAYFALRTAYKALRVIGDIFIEAESATVYGPFSGRNWSPIKGQYTQAMQETPDSGYSQSNPTAANLAATPRLSYSINIPVDGSYTVWALCKVPDVSGDSLHIGLDNTYKFSVNSVSDFGTGKWMWVNLTSKLSAGTAFQNITAGNHTLDIWFREDGFALDRIFLTLSTSTTAPNWLGQTAMLDKNSLTLTTGSTGTLAATVTPAEEADKTVTFSSSNEAVATVTGQTFDAATGTTSITVNTVTTGSAIITATTANGAQTTCDVTVVDVNKVALTDAISNAQGIYDQATEGSVIGQYPIGSKAVLQAAIDHAKGVFENTTATQVQVDSETATLKAALNEFTQSVIKPQAPTWPEGSTLTASNISSSGLTLTWTPAQDDTAVTGYKIYKGLDLIGTVTGSAISFDVTGLSSSTTYTFMVQAGNSAGNWSTNGPSVSETTLNENTPPTGDTTAPTWPQGTLTASNVSTSGLTLTWSKAEDDTAVTGYKIYRGLDLIGTVTGSAISFDVNGLSSSTTYTFMVQAGDPAGNWSTNGPSTNVTTNSNGSGSGNGGGNGSTGSTTTPTTTPAPVVSSQIELKPVLSGSTAKAEVSADNLKKAMDAAKADSDGNKTVTLKVAEVIGAKNYSVELPKTSLTESSNNSLKIESPIGTVVVPSNMFDSKEVNGDKVQIAIGLADQKAIKNEEVKQTVGNRPVIGVNATANGSALTLNNPEAAIKVSLDYKPTAEELKNPEHITVWAINENGAAEAVTSGRYDAKTGKVTFTTNDLGNFAVVYVNKTFEDIDNYTWAKDRIEVMASKGVINGTSETTYTPGNNITRADFIVLLVKALGLNSRANDNFDDVAEGSYYYNALAIAKKLGITTGVGDNKFNPKANISRQDMMVLAEKAMRIAGKDLNDGSAADIAGYKDAAQVSGYAQDAVAALVKEGIIAGSGNKLSPKQTATRAETAVIVYKLYNK